MKPVIIITISFVIAFAPISAYVTYRKPKEDVITGDTFDFTDTGKSYPNSNEFVFFAPSSVTKSEDYPLKDISHNEI